MSEERMISLGGTAATLGPASGSSTLANRVQRTRRDPEGVIQEVLAETVLGRRGRTERSNSAGGMDAGMGAMGRSGDDEGDGSAEDDEEDGGGYLGLGSLREKGEGRTEKGEY